MARHCFSGCHAVSSLDVSKTVKLPLEVVALTLGIVGIRNSGKTNTSVVIVEELLEHSQQVIIIDPLDCWWGLKSSADGKSAGYKVVVLGGMHADVPLSETDGAVIADFLVDNPVPAILSLRHIRTKAGMRRFIRDFAEQLFYRKGQPGKNSPVHIVVDEASLFVPQNVQGDTAPVVGAIQSLVRQGRTAGIGCTLIDQRPATVNKDVLSQVELLVCHRLTGPHDRKALKDWVDANASSDQMAEFLRTVTQLKQGEAWFWSPGWLNLFKIAQVRRRRTYDSSATPKAGKALAAPKKVAEVELDKLRAQLAATIEKNKENDPAVLRKELAAAKQELAKKEKATAAAKPAAAPKEVSLLKEGDRQELKMVQVNLTSMALMLEQTMACVEKLKGDQDLIVQRFDKVLAKIITRQDAVTPQAAAPAPVPRPAPRVAAPRPPGEENGAVALSKAERAILTVLAQYGERTRRRIAVLTGYAHNGGGFRNALGALATRGYLTRTGENTTATPEGLAALGDWTPLPTGRALLDMWLPQISKAEREIMTVLVDAYPQTMTQDELAAATPSQYQPEGGGFRNAVGHLRGLELLTGDRTQLCASAALFDE